MNDACDASLTSFPSLVIEIDRDTRILGMNRRAQKIYACEEGEHHGRSLDTLIPAMAGYRGSIDNVLSKGDIHLRHNVPDLLPDPYRVADLCLIPLGEGDAASIVIRIDTA